MDLSTSVALVRAGIGLSAGALSVPVALGFLPDLSLEQDTEMPVSDLSRDFFGPQLVFSLAPGSDPLPAGLSLSATGRLSGTPTTVEGPLDIVVRATNSEGSADSTFSVTVFEMLLEFTPTLDGATDNPTYGPSAQNGVALTAGGTAFSGGSPATISYQWKTLESGAIVGATEATFTPNAALFDNERLYCTVTPEGYPGKDTDRLVVRHAQPVAAGALWDEILDLGSGTEFYDVSHDFSGAALTYSATGPGVSINPATGLLAIEPNSPVSGATVTVAAVNSGGQATSAFSLTIEGANAGPGPTLGQPALDDLTDTIDLTVDVDSVIYWRRDATGTNPTAGDVISGGGHDSGSFPVTAGATSVDITFSSGNDGLQEISFVAAVTPSEPSIVQTVAIEIDTVDPVLSGMVPAAGSTGVSPSVAPAVTFSEPVVAGNGSVSIYDVTGDAVLESFDIVASAGNGAGTVEISGNTLTIRPSTTLAGDRSFAVLVDQGALTDAAGNAFAGVTDPSQLNFSVGVAAVVDVTFDATFPSQHPALWSSMQANLYNGTVAHLPSETWDAYTASVSDGGVRVSKTGPYPQLRFSVPVEVGKQYAIDADLPIGEAQGGSSWSNILRLKIGSAIDQSDYGLIDETQVGQPRCVQLRGQTIVATSSELWFAVICETAVAGNTGGDPALAMLRVQEV